MSNPTLEKAYVLHTRPYRDTSVLVDFFTENFGRISAVARGVRTAKSVLKSLLQPFTPLLITWRGKQELVTLCNVEAEAIPVYLQKNLLSGLYLNELLIRLLTRFDSHCELFHAYHAAIHRLVKQDNPEWVLRIFELQLLKELGYGLQLDRLPNTGMAINAEEHYDFHPEKGLIPIVVPFNTKNNNLFSGSHLLAIHALEFDNADVLQTAKKLVRKALAPLLANKPIMTRELFLR